MRLFSKSAEKCEFHIDLGCGTGTLDDAFGGPGFDRRVDISLGHAEHASEKAGIRAKAAFDYGTFGARLLARSLAAVCSLDGINFINRKG
jgi:hypothetical protein